MSRSENAFLRDQNSDRPNSLSHNWVSSILIDRQKNLWVGTFGGGVNKTTYREDRQFTEYKNYLKAGNSSQLFHFYANYFVSALYQDLDGEIWVGTYLGLFKYDPNSDDLELYRADINDLIDLKDEAITSLFEDHTGTFWVGTTQQLYLLDRGTKRFLPLEASYEEAARKGLQNISVIYEDEQNTLWFGGKYLKKYVHSDSSFVTYRPDPEDQNSISDENIWALLEGDDGDFWIGTNQGLVSMDRDAVSFTSISFGNDQTTAVHGIAQDERGDLWLSTISGGISKYDPKSGSVKNYDPSDGLVDIEYTKGGLYKDDEGWMYFGTYNGFSVFHPDSIQDNTVLPPVYIDAFYVFNERQLYSQPILSKKKIELDYDQNEFKFHFVALNYLNASKNQYAYMLEGYDEDWNYSGTQRFANYTNMSPGSYVFKVKASNNDGYWNEEGARIAVVIHPPIWKTTWAYCIYVLVFIVMILLLRHYEVGRLRLRQDLEINKIKSEKLAELDKEKSKFFSNISHEFRTPLTLILGPLDRMAERIEPGNEKEELGLVRRNARRLQTLINQLLSISKLEAGKMKLRAHPENIVSLTSLLVQSFSSLAEHNRITLSFESERDAFEMFLDKLKYEKICINILSNAFKFTPQGGEIKVTIHTVPSDKQGDPEELVVQFKDSGIGIVKEKSAHVFDRFYQVEEAQQQDNLGTGIGLSLSKELVELHHGTISVESAPGAGTTFSITLPFGKAHLSDAEVMDHSENVVPTDEELIYEDHLLVPTRTDSPSFPWDEEPDDKIPLILIVDDNDDMRTYIKSYLSDTYQILEARNGKQGMERALEYIPDLIVSDLMMPIVDGNEMTARLKTDERTSHIPVILLTAKASRESKLEGLETGADDFMTKPFDADELQVRIKNLIAQRRKLRAILAQHIGEPGQTRLIRESSGRMMTQVDEQFIEKATAMILEQMSDPDLNVETFASEMAMSRMQLHRKLTSLTGSSASDLIRDLRLKKAAELLKAGELNVTQVSYEIGISSLSNFAKTFKKKYGETPSEYAQDNKGK